MKMYLEKKPISKKVRTTLIKYNTKQEYPNNNKNKPNKFYKFKITHSS